MEAPSKSDLPIVLEPAESAANEAPSRAISLWEVFEALQDEADATASSPEEADDLVCAAFHGIARQLAPIANRVSKAA